MSKEQPRIRIRINAWGLEWFNPLNRSWIQLDEVAKKNVGDQMLQWACELNGV